MIYTKIEVFDNENSGQFGLLEKLIREGWQISYMSKLQSFSHENSNSKRSILIFHLFRE